MWGTILILNRRRRLPTSSLVSSLKSWGELRGIPKRCPTGAEAHHRKAGAGVHIPQEGATGRAGFADRGTRNRSSLRLIRIELARSNELEARVEPLEPKRSEYRRAKRFEFHGSTPEIWIAHSLVKVGDEGARPVPHRPRRADRTPVERVSVGDDRAVVLGTVARVVRPDRFHFGGLASSTG